jgi:hypothetical protein
MVGKYAKRIIISSVRGIIGRIESNAMTTEIKYDKMV